MKNSTAQKGGLHKETLNAKEKLLLNDIPFELPEYRFLEHTTDAEIEAYGKNLEEAFQNAAKALEDTLVDVGTIKATTRKKVRIVEKDKESLLYSWLEWLIISQDVEGMLYSKFKCKLGSNPKENTVHLEATALGEKYDPSKHQQKTAIKAPTYHGMSIIDEPQGVRLRFLLDL